MSERQLKGGVILGYFDFIKHQWGEDGVNDCIEATGIDPKILKEETFYPSKANERILKWISDTHGREHLQKAGNHVVKNLGSLSYLVKFVNIKHLLKRAKSNYENAFDFGEISVLLNEHGKCATVIMKDCNSIEESYVAWLGAFEGMMEVTNTKGTVMLNKREIDGDEYDEYLLDWM